MNVKKLILVTSSGHPLDKVFREVTEEVSKELGIENEVRQEDYAFLSDFGEKDDLGMSWVPQLLAQKTDGQVVPILTQFPLDEKFKPDKAKGREETIRKIKNL
ncbi:hypothetical protein HS1genome_0109 [Sulfodiicoccus acidiphilus]|uniref:Flavodoxin-like domain-containing protein n=1 Tax=Sulfodiicoccus acidiphilus TaxID=1670455 RepID=A0A348B0L8_9CREN|nr:hypothetical protein [Sulfodiicoccus acidiphilus]BBD71720.1 hypothetical protein HS1genome_0109 [Sulfodiicoccus acidiphilus]GGT86360.1 hypothetical protein GCM10007116_00370 [Sulfodiicoccus acidiphilus]